MHMLHVVGARPNFMKAAPVLRSVRQFSANQQTLVHTGQHYDSGMSDIFFQELEMPAPDVNLGVGSGSHAQQTAEILSRLEPVLLNFKPDIVLVYGDVNSTLAAALVCAKLQIPVAHVEAGLRSFDRSMPEEINRVITDHISNYLFTHCQDADCNLQREGIASETIYNVGNTIIDSLIRFLPKAGKQTTDRLPERYALVTLHRPSNVDDPCALKQILQCLTEISQELKIVFPVHPRTCRAIAGFGIDASRLHLMGPQPYLGFLRLELSATVVITDSGGVQEETTYLGVPCLTLRPNTERPITVKLGTNIVVGNDTTRIRSEVSRILEGNGKRGTIPPLWDGHAGERIAEKLQRL
jgi:UDP-N-acetylglucosamine 2-epimerase (non-hydrolysing)